MGCLCSNRGRFIDSAGTQNWVVAVEANIVGHKHAFAPAGTEVLDESIFASFLPIRFLHKIVLGGLELSRTVAAVCVHASGNHVDPVCPLLLSWEREKFGGTSSPGPRR